MAPADDDELSSVIQRRAELEATDFRARAQRTDEAGRPELLFPTVLHALSAAAKLGEGLGITIVQLDGHEERRSYRFLYNEAKRLAVSLERQGLRRGDRVLLLFPTSFDFFTAFFAVGVAGAVPVPAAPPTLLEDSDTTGERLLHQAEHAAATFCLHAEDFRKDVKALQKKARLLRHAFTLSELPPDSGPLPRSKASHRELGLLQYTSGSTGAPRGVALTHQNLAFNCHAIGAALKLDHRDLAVSWLPMHHDMGLIGTMLTCVYWRMPLVLLPPEAILLDPAAWLRAISRHKATISNGPNFAYALVNKRVDVAELSGVDLSSWRIAANGAERVSVDTMGAFARKFAPLGFKAESFAPAYGLAESTVAVTFHAPPEPMRVLHVDRVAMQEGRIEDAPGGEPIVGLGRAVPGTTLQVLNDQGVPLPDRRIGELHVSGPSVMRGYYRDPDATEVVLKDGRLATGDVGFLENGVLFLTGRKKDLLIVRGQNHAPEDVELAAESAEGVRGGGAIAFSLNDSEREAIVLVAETKITGGAEKKKLEDLIREKVSARSGLKLDDVVLIAPGELPKTTSGKKQRGRARALYREGKFSKVGLWSRLLGR